MSVGSLSNYPPVQQYLQARKNLHEDIRSQDLLGSHAVLVDDQVTLKQDWVHHDPSGNAADDVRYKAGTTYSLDPYSNRDASFEAITLEAHGETTLIQHKYEPGFLKTSESLSVDSVASGGFIGNGGSFSLSQTDGGLRPDGWMQDVLQEQGADGYILKM